MLGGDCKFFLKLPEKREEGRRPHLIPLVVERPETLIGFFLTPRNLGRLVGREALHIVGTTREGGRLGKLIGGGAVILHLVAQEDSETLVEEITLGIVPDTALQKVTPQIDVLAARQLAKDLALLLPVLHGGGAGIPGHMPRGDIPVEERVGLQGGDGVEERVHAPPLGLLPCDVRLDPEQGGKRRAEAAQRGEKTRLADLLAQAQVEHRRAETGFLGEIL